MTTTRGLRNNNPGNIRKSGDKWQGLAREQADAEFFTFQSMEWGVRATARILIKYQDSYGLHTIQDIISRWAPSVENDTKNYIKNVSIMMGISSVTGINVHK